MSRLDLSVRMSTRVFVAWCTKHCTLPRSEHVFQGVGGWGVTQWTCYNTLGTGMVTSTREQKAFTYRVDEGLHKMLLSYCILSLVQNMRKTTDAVF